MFAISRWLGPVKRTLAHAVPMALFIVAVNFALLQFAPGDMADVIAAENENATAEQVAALREDLGLNLPLLTRLSGYVGDLARLDLGYSHRFEKPVSELLMQRLPQTFLLMATAWLLALVLGIAIGMAMAVNVNRWPDRLGMAGAVLFYSTPPFWLGLSLIIIFSVYLGWLPAGGAGKIGSRATGLDAVIEQARYLILPALTLAFQNIAVYARLTRTSMLQVMDQDYVRTARAKGISRAGVLFRHVLRNAMLPLTTVAGYQFSLLLSGAVVTETVFSWPGLGRLMYEAISGRDFTVLLGIVLLGSFLVLVVNMLVDIVQSFLDPRIEA